MSSINYDIAYLQAGLEQLESYLLSTDLFGQLHAKALPGELPFASLTLGNVLLSMKKLSAYHLEADQVDIFHELEGRLDVLRSRWRVAWEEKVKQEYPVRLRQWARFLEEVRRDPENHADRYAYEVRLRVILDLLGEEVEGLVVENEDKLFALDDLLRRDFLEGVFVWDEGMREGFPKEVYWYLWGRVV